MNKTELSKQLATSLDKSQKECREFLDATLSLIETSLVERKDVKLSGFGTFKLKHRPSRDAQIPSSGEWVPTFVSADRLVTACSSVFEAIVDLPHDEDE